MAVQRNLHATPVDNFFLIITSFIIFCKYFFILFVTLFSGFDVQSSVMRDVNVYMYPRDISLILTIVYSLELNLNYFLRAF